MDKSESIRLLSMALILLGILFFLGTHSPYSQNPIPEKSTSFEITSGIIYQVVSTTRWVAIDSFSDEELQLWRDAQKYELYLNEETLRDEIQAKYAISLYDNAGRPIKTFYIDDELCLFSDDKYKIVNEKINQLIKEKLHTETEG